MVQSYCQAERYPRSTKVCGICQGSNLTIMLHLGTTLHFSPAKLSYQPNQPMGAHECLKWVSHVFTILFPWVQGVSKKSGICFMITISIKLNTNLLGIYLIWKVGSIAPSGVQMHFYAISGSCGISKKIWGTRFQEFEIMNNLISLNPPRLMHNFSSYEYLEGLQISYLKGDILRPVSCSNSFL